MKAKKTATAAPGISSQRSQSSRQSSAPLPSTGAPVSSDPRKIFDDDPLAGVPPATGRKPGAGAVSGAPPPPVYKVQVVDVRPPSEGEIETTLEPLTSAASDLLKAAGSQELSQAEGKTWRSTAARVARKYLSTWLLPEIFFTIATVAIPLRRVKGIKAIASVLAGGALLFAVLVFLHRRRLKLQVAEGAQLVGAPPPPVDELAA